MPPHPRNRARVSYCLILPNSAVEVLQNDGGGDLRLQYLAVLAPALIGMRLKQHRLDAGLTVEQCGAELLSSSTKVARIEAGLRAPSPRDVRDLGSIYGLGVGEVAALRELLIDARRIGRPVDLSDWREDGLFIPSLGISSRVVTFQIDDFPRVLCNPRYRDLRAPGFGGESRQIVSILTGTLPPDLVGLVGRAAIDRCLDGSTCAPEVARAQLSHVLGLARLPNVSLRVINGSPGASYDRDGVTYCYLADPKEMRGGPGGTLVWRERASWPEAWLREDASEGFVESDVSSAIEARLIIQDALEWLS
jgi:hypothetical protein